MLRTVLGDTVLKKAFSFTLCCAVRVAVVSGNKASWTEGVRREWQIFLLINLLFFYSFQEENMKLLDKKICAFLGFCILVVLCFFFNPPPPPPLWFSGQVLRDSGVFEYTWKELSVWLEHLDNTKEDKKEAVIQFLERVTTVQISWINNAKNSINGN